MRRAARRLALVAALLLGAPALQACGFTPLYGEPGVAGPLAGVAVVTNEHSRPAYLFREQLDDTLGRDRGAPAPYRLVATITTYRLPLGVRVNNVANRYEVGLTATWRLEEAATGKTLTSGSSTGRVSYDSADAPYGGVAAEQDGEERAANQAAILVRFTLARWFARHPAAAPAP